MMKSKVLFKSLLAVILLYFSANVSMGWAQEKPNFLFFKNGQPVDLTKSYSLEELKSGVVVNQTEDLEIAHVYLVRDLRPIKALQVKDQANLQKFELYAWGMGPEEDGKNVASHVLEPVLKPGDRFVFDAIWKGTPISFALKVK
ncbi:hypothetical protein [Rufibacter hautae]|uniref:Uncharacterized protein n=1 Tax=Rufibacter hautae TaxID=2595005 RepID=A0A5B6TH24_9BACT|nr:hypothetical protein [Rufibacter hautae]KAA3439972.1 hypothetical protein FOA19_04700 [Rufibacter hautae]